MGIEKLVNADVKCPLPSKGPMVDGCVVLVRVDKCSVLDLQDWET